MVSIPCENRSPITVQPIPFCQIKLEPIDLNDPLEYTMQVDMLQMDSEIKDSLPELDKSCITKQTPNKVGNTCPTCNKTFKYKHHLLYHKNYECNRYQVCKHCHKKFKFLSYLKNHLKGKCPLAPSRSKRSSNPNRITRLGNRNRETSCIYCQKVFTNNREAALHISKKSCQAASKPLISCSKCHTRFTERRYVERHMRRSVCLQRQKELAKESAKNSRKTSANMQIKVKSTSKFNNSKSATNKVLDNVQEKGKRMSKTNLPHIKETKSITIKNSPIVNTKISHDQTDSAYVKEANPLINKISSNLQSKVKIYKKTHSLRQRQAKSVAKKILAKTQNKFKNNKANLSDVKDRKAESNKNSANLQIKDQDNSNFSSKNTKKSKPPTKKRLLPAKNKVKSSSKVNELVKKEIIPKISRNAENLNVDEEKSVRKANINKMITRLPCPNCSRTFKYKHHLTFHIQNECGKTLRQCKSCNESFVSHHLLQEHINEKICLQFCCPKCSKGFSQVHLLEQHLCEGISMQVESNNESNTENLMLNHKLEPEQFNELVNTCGSDNLEKIHDMKAEVISYTCPNCNKVYEHERHLQFHVNYECGKELICEFCHVKFKYVKSLRMHTKNKICQNEGEETSNKKVLGDSKNSSNSRLNTTRVRKALYTCRKCSRRFTCEYNFIRHKGSRRCEKQYRSLISKRSKKQSSPKPAECFFCSSIFADSMAYHLHLRDAKCENESTFVCPSCLGYFSSQVTLEKHQDDCSTEYQCWPCRTTFECKAAYEAHIGNFCQNLETCHKCGHAYVTKSSLKRHLTYCGLDPQFACFHCPYVCYLKETLVRHIRSVHK